jgi:hypothetical protein
MTFFACSEKQQIENQFNSHCLSRLFHVVLPSVLRVQRTVLEIVTTRWLAGLNTHAMSEDV